MCLCLGDTILLEQIILTAAVLKFLHRCKKLVSPCQSHPSTETRQSNLIRVHKTHKMCYILSSAVWHFPLHLQDLLLSAGRLTLLPINPCATFRSRCLDLVCHRQLNLRDIPLGMLLCATNNILFFLFPLISLDRPSNVTHFFVEKAQTTVKSHASSCFENWTHFQTTGLGTSCWKDRIHHLNLRKLVFWKYHGSAVKLYLSGLLNLKVQVQWDLFISNRLSNFYL